MTTSYPCQVLSLNGTVIGTEHSLWKELSSNTRSLSNTSDTISAPHGLSRIINGYLWQLSVDVKNFWHGNIFKCMGYLLRILLRIHLVPMREEAFIRRKEGLQSTTKETTRSARGTLSEKCWKKRLNDLFNEQSKTRKQHHKPSSCLPGIIALLKRTRKRSTSYNFLNRQCLKVSPTFAGSTTGCVQY